MLDVLARTLDRWDLLLPLGLLTVDFGTWSEVALDGLRLANKAYSMIHEPGV